MRASFLDLDEKGLHQLQKDTGMEKVVPGFLEHLDWRSRRILFLKRYFVLLILAFFWGRF